MAPILRFAEAALFSVLLASVARAQSTTVPPEKSWALAASAILAEGNGDRHDRLEGRPRTPENIAYAVRLLRSSWSIADRNQLQASLRSVGETGYRQYFTRLGKRAELRRNNTPQDFE